MPLVRLWAKLFVLMWGIYLPIATMIYLFSDDSAGKVHNAGIYSAIAQELRLIDDDNDAISRREAQIKALIRLRGGEPDATVYGALKRRNNITDLAINDYSTKQVGEVKFDVVRIFFRYKGKAITIDSLVMNNRSFFHPFRVEMAGAQEISIALDADHHVHFTNEHRIVDFLGDLALKTENIPFIDHIIEQEQ